MADESKKGDGLGSSWVLHPSEQSELEQRHAEFGKIILGAKHALAYHGDTNINVELDNISLSHGTYTLTTERIGTPFYRQMFAGMLENWVQEDDFGEQFYIHRIGNRDEELAAPGSSGTMVSMVNRWLIRPAHIADSASQVPVVLYDTAFSNGNIEVTNFVIVNMTAQRFREFDAAQKAKRNTQKIDNDIENTMRDLLGPLMGK